MSKAQTNSTTRASAARPPSESPHPIFDAMIMEAMRTPPEDLLSHAELGRQLGITDEERAAAQAIIACWDPDEPDEGNDTEVAENAPADGVVADRPRQQAAPTRARKI